MNKRQVARLAIVPFLASLVLMTGCTETVDLQLGPKVNAYVMTDSKQAISVAQTDAAYIELNEWLRANRTGWHPTAGRYPGGVYLKSGDDGIQVAGMEIIIYSTDGSEPNAEYIHHIGRQELSAVRALGQP